MSLTRSCLAFLLFCICFSPAFLHAQAYTSIVVIGDSLSDTGNAATVSKNLYTVNAQVPGPATGYTDGRFTDGLDTSPAARNYRGVWVEQFAAKLAAKPPILNSLAGGTNYAYGFATTNTGTSSFAYGPGSVLVFQVNNMGKQLTDYLATNPAITNKTLFVVWGGANDLIAASTQQDIVSAAAREAGIVQTLITAGATEFIVPNLPPLGLVPRYNGSAATSTPVTQAAAAFNQALAAALASLPAANPGKTLHIYPLDTYTLFNTIVAAPGNYGFANITAMSQGNTTINPDTYLFWDNLHPTTYGHSLIAASAFALLGTPVATTLQISSQNTNANLNSNVVLTAVVSGASGPPVGTVTFLDGSTALGSTVVTGTGTSATGNITVSTLTAGSHTITATFTGVNGFANSSSNTVTQVVVAPAFSASLSPSSITVASGSSTSSTLTVTPVGGYSGTATFTCGTLPAHFSCSFSPTTVTLAANTAATTTLTIGTSAAAALSPMERPGDPSRKVLACGLFPGLAMFGMVLLRRRKGARRTLYRSGAMWMCGIAGVMLTLALSGCGGNSNNAAKGSYTVPVNITANGSTTTQNLTVVVQ